MVSLKDLPEPTVSVIVPYKPEDSLPGDVTTIATRDYAFYKEILTLLVVVKSPIETTHELYTTWQEEYSNLVISVAVVQPNGVIDSGTQKEQSHLVRPFSVTNSVKQQTTRLHDKDSLSPKVLFQENGDIIHVIHTAVNPRGLPFDEHVKLSVTASLSMKPCADLKPNHGDDWFIENMLIQSLEQANINEISRQKLSTCSVPIYSNTIDVSLRVLPPPVVSRSTHTPLGGTSYVSVSLINVQPIPIDVTKAILSLIPTPDNKKTKIGSSGSTTSSVTSPVMVVYGEQSGVDEGISDSNVDSNSSIQSLWNIKGDKTQFPITLAPSESHTFVFSIQQVSPSSHQRQEKSTPQLHQSSHSPQPSIARSESNGSNVKSANKGYKSYSTTGSLCTVLALTWSAGPLLEQEQFLTCQYIIGEPMVVDSATLSISMTVPEVVYSHSKFPVSFNIMNASSKSHDVSLILCQPRLGATTTTEKVHSTDANAQLMADEKGLMQYDESQASLVCMDETIYL
eukprot:Ihof_evm3s124 gene=Ihof_evmTU3s124